MASRGTRPQDLSTGSNLEAFRHCFARFAACDGLRHKARKLIRADAMTNALLWCVCTGPRAFGVHKMEPWVARRGELVGASESNVVQFVGCNLPHGNSHRSSLSVQVLAGLRQRRRLPVNMCVRR